MYLQIEEATRLTVRLSERSGHARQTHDFRIKKAGRFRGGASAAVAEVTFGDGESYLALKDGGIVDMDATMRRLDRMRELIAGMPRGLKKVVDGSKKGLTKAAWSGGSHNESREPHLWPESSARPPQQPGTALHPSNLPNDPAYRPGRFDAMRRKPGIANCRLTPDTWKVIKSFRHHIAQRGGPDKRLSLLFLSWGRENMG